MGPSCTTRLLFDIRMLKVRRQEARLNGTLGKSVKPAADTRTTKQAQHLPHLYLNRLPLKKMLLLQTVLI